MTGLVSRWRAWLGAREPVERSAEGGRRDRSEVLPSAAVRSALGEALGWCAVGLVNAVFVFQLGQASSLVLRAAHHGYDLAYFALLAVMAGGLAFGWSQARLRVRPARALSALLAIALVGTLARFALREDLAGFLERQALPAWFPAAGLIALGFALAYVALALFADHWAARLGWLGLGVAAAVTALNNLALPPDYPGLHLFAAACAARVAGAGLSSKLRATSVRLGWLVAAGALVVAGALPLGLPPRTAIWRHLFEVPGSVAPPFVAKAWGEGSWAERAFIPARSAAWFRDRSAAPARPPSDARLLPERPIVLLLTIDALRADVVASGKHDAQLPELAALRRSSIWFSLARSPSPSTLTSALAIFTSRYYSQTYWTNETGKVFPTLDQTPRWPTMLTERGVRTVNVCGLHDLCEETGVGRGFIVQRKTKRRNADADDVMRSVIAELEDMKEVSGVVYTHFGDAHAPYDRAGSEGTPFERYLRELALVDREFGRLRKYLDSSGLRERTLLVVSADHGEAFGEHGMNYHARSVYDELLRVPLLFRFPEARERRVDVAVSLIDLGPTFLDLFGQPIPGPMMGESLVPALAGKPFEPARPIAADSGRRIQALIFPDGVKASRDLMHHTREVYDLTRDPGELHDLVDVPDAGSERYLGALDTFFKAHTLRRPGWEPPWRKF